MNYNDFNELKGGKSNNIVINSLIDLQGESVTFPQDSIIIFNGGGFINRSGTSASINLNNSKCYPSFDEIIHIRNTGTISISGMKEGTYKYDYTNHKPIWWNGTAWVDATGTPV